jgi:hypothetical protein
MRFCFLAFFILCFQYSFGQSYDSLQKPCLTDEMSRIRGISPYEKKEFKKELEDDGQVFVIPVIFHIIYSTPSPNVDNIRVHDQVRILNEDYGRYGGGTNNNTLSEDAKIRFCLVSRDSLGNPHPGIIYIQSPYARLKTGNELATKNLSRWNPNRYLNIWVVDSINGGSGSYITKGYAYYPPGSIGQPWDGVVVTYDVLGVRPRLNHGSLGHACSHEVGHYLNLIHPWGTDDSNTDCVDHDGCTDTPPCTGPFFSTTINPCKAPVQCGSTRQIENYMDYADDICRDLFTHQQIQRMRSAIVTYRSFLVSYTNSVVDGCQDTFRRYEPPTSDDMTIHPNPASSYFYLYPDFIATEASDIFIFDMLGKQVAAIHEDNLESDRRKISLPPNTANGVYVVIVKTPNNTYKQKLVVVGN